MKKPVSVVITDLDDTLWDWVEIWYCPFKAMLDKLVETSGVTREELLRDFKEVYTQHGTSEYAFALEELPSLLRKHPDQDIPAIYAEAVDAYCTTRREVLRLYPDVLETLESIKDRGALIVGYTESLAFYTRYRLRTLGLDRILDYLYSPADHDLPKGLTLEAIRKYSSEHYELRRTIHRHTPKDSEKPCPEVLLKILDDIGAKPDEAIYIGDKLVKDVAMAQAAGVTDIHAAYGEAHNREEYELLRSVTHWTTDAVQKEKETTPEQIKPSYELSKSIAELHDHFEFVPFIDFSQERTAHVMDAWKKAIDVQQHFNNIEMKIRNYMIMLVVAVLGAASIAVKEGLPSLAGWLSIFGVVGVALFGIMDGFWYHRLLIGAVRHAIGIERRYVKRLPEIGLSGAIGRASPIKIGKFTIHSTTKLLGFYGIICLLLIAASIFFFWACPTTQTPSEAEKPPSESKPAVNIHNSLITLEITPQALSPKELPDQPQSPSTMPTIPMVTNAPGANQ